MCLSQSDGLRPTLDVVVHSHVPSDSCAAFPIPLESVLESLLMVELPLFPLNTVLFPTAPLTLHIFEERYKDMVSRCIAEDIPFGVVLIREGREVGAPSLPFEVGTTAQSVSVAQLVHGRSHLLRGAPAR